MDGFVVVKGNALVALAHLMVGYPLFHMIGDDLQ
jgi:hypothetical protein